MNAVVETEIKIIPVMIGTAGHVDHGKTALVRHLTGCDTDCLPEEKKRGMSIDLGFAPYRFSGGRMVGVIDVPGHEDFIKNMVAGASSIDVLMLVVAADDGIMPQTVEHLRIVSLLGPRGGVKVMAVITKIDLVTPDRQQEVREAMTSFLAENGFSDAPVVLMSNRTLEGLEAVRLALDWLVEKSQQAPVTKRAFRMDVERVFSPPGVGSIVTGIPVSGQCAVGNKLELFPGPVATACRAVQKYGHESREADAHTCCAMTIRDIKAADISRGMTLAAPGYFKETFTAVLAVKNVHDAVTIKRRQEMRFCCGTFTRVVAGLLLGKNTLGPGEQGFMQIETKVPMVVAAGDRMLLRTLSPAATIAGGLVLSRHIDPRRKKSYLTLERLEKARFAAQNNDPFASELYCGCMTMVDRSDLRLLTGSPDYAAFAEDKVNEGLLKPLGTSKWIISDRVSDLEARLITVLERYHRENKASRGLPAAQVCTALDLDHGCLEGLVALFSESNAVSVDRNVFALRGVSPQLSARQEVMRELFIEAVRAAEHGAFPQALLQAQLNATDQEMQFLVRSLSDEGLVVTVGHYLILASVVAGCQEKLKALFRKEKVVELGAFRQATGFSRNLAVPVLEYFDAQGMTSRVGKGRQLVRCS